MDSGFALWARPGMTELDRLGQQRQLARGGVLPALVREQGRIIAGEAMVGELRMLRVTAFFAHRAVDALDREEGQRIRTDELAHAFEIVRRCQQLVALRRV